MLRFPGIVSLKLSYQGTAQWWVACRGELDFLIRGTLP